MLGRNAYAFSATLLSVSLLLGTGSAFAQKNAQPLLPSVNLGLSVPKVGVGLNVPVAVPKISVAIPTLPPTRVVPLAPALPPVAVAPPALPVSLPAQSLVPPVQALVPALPLPDVKIDAKVVLPIVPADLAVGVDTGKLGASATVNLPAIGGLTPPVNSALSASLGGEAPKLDVSVSTGGPAVGGLIPPLNTRVNVNTAASGPLLEIGAGSPPVPDTYAPAPAPQGQQVAQRRLDLVPTCR